MADTLSQVLARLLAERDRSLRQQEQADRCADPWSIRQWERTYCKGLEFAIDACLEAEPDRVIDLRDARQARRP